MPMMGGFTSDVRVWWCGQCGRAAAIPVTWPIPKGKRCYYCCEWLDLARDEVMPLEELHALALAELFETTGIQS